MVTNSLQQQGNNGMRVSRFHKLFNKPLPQGTILPNETKKKIMSVRGTDANE